MDYNPIILEELLFIFLFLRRHIEGHFRVLHCTFFNFYFQSFCSIFCSNRALIDNNTCSIDKVLPCINITHIIGLSKAKAYNYTS